MDMDNKQTKRQRAGNALSADEREELKADILRHGNIMGPQIRNWIRDAGHITGLVANGESDLVPVFWIRLYGILNDVAEIVARQAEFLESMGKEAPECSRMEEAIDGLAKVFTDDELVYLQYRRHVECHPLQTAYRLDLTSKGLKDRVAQRLASKPSMTVAETDAAIDRVLTKFGIRETEIAIDFAKRALASVSFLQLASVEWCGPG